MDAVPAAEGLNVAEVIRSMTDSEVCALLDEAYASGMLQTLSDVTRVLARVRPLDVPSAGTSST